jgi:hypothetical protein
MNIKDHEKITSETFNKRRILEKPNYNNSKCPSLIKKNGKLEPLKYELAELKSSLLIQNLINNDIINSKLTHFLQKMLLRYYNNNNKFNLDLLDYSELIEYDSNILDNSYLTDNMTYIDINNYPVSQILKFFNKPNEIKKDFLALYNFMRYIYSEHIISNINNYMLINLTIQKIMNIQSIARGDRYIENNPNYENNTDNVGITNIVPEPNYLKRIVKHDPDSKNEPWFHPGRGRCNFPHMGTYGKLIEEYKKENNFYASVQCGISASTNFCSMMYLLSLINGKTNYSKYELEEDVDNIILSTTIVLVADGGHNIRETVTGITIMAIFLKFYLDQIKYELDKYMINDSLDSIDFDSIDYDLLGNNIINFDLDNDDNDDNGTPLLFFIKKYIRLYINSNKKLKELKENKNINIIDIFKYFIKMFSKWENFINILYDKTKDINPLGVTENDIKKEINGFNKNDIKKYKEDIFEKLLYKIMFMNVDSTKIDPVNYAQVALALSLDNDRYKFNNFKDKCSIFYENIIKSIVINGNEIGNNIIELTNKQMENIINKCNNDKEYKININDKPESIPYAFIYKKKSIRKSRKNRNKSIRKSRNKSIRKNRNKSIRKSRNKSIRKNRNKSIRKSRNKSIRKSRNKSIRKSRNKSIRKNRNKSIRKSRNK